MSFYKKLVWDMSLKYYGLQKSICELKSLSLEITEKCNLQCRHCYMESKLDASSQELSAQEWMDFFDGIKKDFGKKISIQITGGEPLAKAGIFEILKHLKESGFRVTMATNGTLFDDSKIEELKKYVGSISVSLDGFKASHDYLRGAEVFDLTLANIKKAQAAGMKNIAIKTTVYKKNFSEMEKFYDFLQETGIDTWHFFAMEPRGRGRLNRDEVLSAEEYEQLCGFVDKIKADKKRKMRIVFEEQPGAFMGRKTFECGRYKLCHAGISSCTILPTGDVVNCIQGNRDMVQGNIKEEKFKDIWEKGFQSCRSEKYRSCRKHHFNSN